MSGSMAIIANVETTLSLLQRKISIDGLSFSDSNYLLKLSNGEVVKDGECPCISEGKVILPNREYYSGSLLGSLPEGSGKYMWTDGCKYEGEWRAGVRHGYGKLQWPCGAFYVGEFSGGYMNGNGTYTGADRTYKGRWRLNLKHGLGYELYSCGDVIEGTWIRGTPEGPCKYSWAIGNVYLGNMKAGKMSGKGTLTWINGDTYEGSWFNDMMNGFGVYTWGDGSCYIGTWTRGLKDGMGTFYPRFSRLPPGQQLYLNALRKRGLLPDFRKLNQVSHIRHPSLVDMEGNTKNVGNQGSRKLTLSSSSSSSDRVSKGNLMNLEQSSRTANVSLQRRWSLEVSIDKVIGDDFSEFCGDDGDHEDTNSPILEREYMQGVLISELVVNSFSLSSKTDTRRKKMLTLEIKKPGETIIKGHRRYDLMLCLQLGIRYTVGKNTPTLGREARASDFGSRASFWMNFNKDGSQLTPPHQADDFKWKDYCPMVFRNLREMFKIDAADYMMSICGNDTLQELSSPGKSGSAFFLSQDDRFMIKTLRKSEVKVLLQILPAYHQHVQTYENTLITKFFGLHRIIPSSGQKFRFVVMGNMFCTEPRIHRRFDLKGSSLGRSADKVEIDENTILKDLDLNYCFYLEPSWQEAVLKQIEIDSKFLESMHIMDYSLLLGVHYRAPQHLKSLMCTRSERFTADGLEIVAEEEALQDEISPQGLILVPRGSDDKSVTVGSHIRGGRLRASSATGDEEVDLLLPGTARLQIQLGVNMPARAECIGGKEDNKVFNEAYDVVLYLGIIDILQDYNITKKIEHAYKSMQFDSLSISAVDPTFYSQRFLHFIQKVFPRKCYS